MNLIIFKNIVINNKKLCQWTILCYNEKITKPPLNKFQNGMKFTFVMKQKITILSTCSMQI